MTRGTCGHKHGAHIPTLGLWVCGQCFAKLDSRPTRYGMVGSVKGAGGPPMRQEIVWQSRVRISAERTTLADFLAAMVRRLQSRSRDLSASEAYDIALDVLRTHTENFEFGDPQHDWSRISAIDLADEEMSYWETENDGANA